jgi:hypothetical protein
VRYKLKDLRVSATPDAEKMFEFKSLRSVEFDFPGTVRTVVFTHCGLVKASQKDGQDYYEMVGSLYESDNPVERGEKYVGKLYMHLYGYPDDERFETQAEQFEWHADGSFEIIMPDGRRIRRGPSGSP